MYEEIACIQIYFDARIDTITHEIIRTQSHSNAFR